MKPRLLVPQQVPEFVRAEYPAFIEFLKAYYQWMDEEYSVGKLETLVDIDDTVDSFVQYFRRQLDIYGVTVNTEDRIFLRNIKQLYTAKGSSAGFEFLFKILFNKSSSVMLPWDYVFKPSAGDWKQDVTVIVDVTLGDAANLVGNPVIITDEAGVEYRTVILNLNRRGDGYAELFINRFSHQADLISISSIDGTTTGDIIHTTTKAFPTKPGSGFSVGQVFSVDTNGGTGTLIKVKSVNTAGGITAIDIVRFGAGYTTDFNAFLTPTAAVDPTTIGSRITLGDFTYPTNDVANSQSESGSIVNHDYTNFTTGYFNDPTYVGKTVAEFNTTEFSIPPAGTDYAIINFVSGHMCIYPGYYLTSNSILDDLVYIQDSKYYQLYSYVTVLEETVDQYSAILKEVLHPVGTEFFATYAISNNYQLDPQSSPSLNLISKSDIIRDFVVTVEQLIFDMTRALTDVATTSEQVITAAGYNRSHEDLVITSDATAMTVSVPFTDTLITSEAKAFTFNKPLTTLTTITEVISLNPTKYNSDSIVTSDQLTTSVSYNKSYEDTVITLDVASKQVSTFLATGVGATDQISVVPGIGVFDTTTNSDAAVITTTKYNSDSTNATTQGRLAMEPYYVEPLTYYWEAEYLENERLFTN